MAYAARPTYDPETEAKLDEWVQAKRARDFATSDAIQAELEAQGVDTYVARPDARKPGGGKGAALAGGCGLQSGGTYDRETEAKLNEWVQAKRARDFVTSDAIQEELAAQGVDTKAARPDPKKAGASPWGASGGAGPNLWGAGGGTYDRKTEAKLDQWVEAKRARDFTKSDAIQAELEAQGIDTYVARPDARKPGAAGPDLWSGHAFGSASNSRAPSTARPAYDPKTEARLDEWVRAKRARDFTVSDAIQAELEAQGVDPKAARPDPKKAGANWDASGGAGGGNPMMAMMNNMMTSAARPTYDPRTEAMLDEWVRAKRARDFTKSDAIQAELEAQGVEPKVARPDSKKAGANSWDASGGGGDGNPMMAMMNNMMMAMMNNSPMMQSHGGKGSGKGKGKWGPY